MSVFFSSLNINSFRGIKGLQISGLRDVNIIAGNNNVGKTSVLEAIALLRNPYSFYNVIRTTRMREGVFARNTLYENINSMFPRDEMIISVEAKEDNYNVRMELQGEEEMLLLEGPSNDYMEIIGISGELIGEDSAGMQKSPFRVSYASKQRDYPVTPSRRDIEYVPPGSHLQGNVFDRIVKNDSYKAICIRLLQLFDEDIVDLLYLNNAGRAVEYIKHKKIGVMPLNTYGDGIKKVLSLANHIASAAGGILMIDEVETSINYKYYHDVFNFLIKACREFNVQLFITTHNIEAIDGILGTQSYNEKTENDPINVVTFRKDNETGEIRSRSLSGREVYVNRENFNFEVRL